jgi:hypothetical protein
VQERHEVCVHARIDLNEDHAAGNPVVASPIDDASRIQPLTLSVIVVAPIGWSSLYLGGYRTLLSEADGTLAEPTTEGTPD